MPRMCHALSLHSMPAHCQTFTARAVGAERQWKEAWCGGTALSTLASPSAAGCVSQPEYTGRHPKRQKQQQQQATGQPPPEPEADGRPKAGSGGIGHEAGNYASSELPIRELWRGRGGSRGPIITAYRESCFESRELTGTLGICDRRVVTPAGRSYFFLGWWLLTTSSSQADEIGAMADARLFEETAAIIAARLSAVQPAPAPWLAPPQWMSTGEHLAWHLRRRMNATISWAATLTPDVHFGLPEHALRTPHAACEPPDQALAATHALAHLEPIDLLPGGATGRGSLGGMTSEMTSGASQRRRNLHTTAHHALAVRQRLIQLMPRDHVQSDVHLQAPERLAASHPASHAPMSQLADWDGRLESRASAAGAPRGDLPSPMRSTTARGLMPGGAGDGDSGGKRADGGVSNRDGGVSADGGVSTDHGGDRFAKGRAALSFVEQGEAGGESNPLHRSCAAGRHRFLCAPTSDTCLSRAASTPLRERSGFVRVFVKRAAQLWQQRLEEERGGGVNVTRHAEELTRLWLRPCLVLRSAQCGRDLAVAERPAFAARTWAAVRRRKRRLERGSEQRERGKL